MDTLVYFLRCSFPNLLERIPSCGNLDVKITLRCTR
uniref:Uncharacterized protein n=1 Tax=Arundo donax TaxID=35708 RepID=A0A0A8ZP38_ARUDO